MEAEALYDYEATENDQLSFMQGNTIKILKAEGDWFDGEIGGNLGVVPANYITFHAPLWYSVVTKPEAVQTLNSRNAHEANFLVRPSRTTPGEMSLSVKINDVQHFKILRDPDGLYYIWSDNQHFNSINQLVNHYKTNSVSRAEHFLLKETGSGGGTGAGRSAGGGGRSRGSRVGGGGVSGGVGGAASSSNTVTAKYDFEARSDLELTIYAGDVITVIQREEPFIKGSIRRNSILQTGLFPANYV